MTDSMDSSNPLQGQPSEGSYRVMRKDREKDRQRRFDPLFQELEDDENDSKDEKQRPEKKNETKKAKAVPVKDTIEINGNGESTKKIEKSASDNSKDDTSSNAGNLVDMKA